MAVVSDAGVERPTSWATTGERRGDGDSRRWHPTGPRRSERIDGPGHWMQLEAPDTVNQLLDFLPR
jgi:hypothetical protein